MSKLPLTAGAGLLCAVLAAPASAVLSAPPTAIYGFGDSLNDTGNVFIGSGNTIPASPPYFNGRFSDGPIWIESLAAGLGKPIDPAAGGGTNFSVGGARTSDIAGIGALTVDGDPAGPGQVDGFLTAFGGVADPDALYVLDGGGNDILAITTNPVLLLTAPQIAIDNVILAINKLAGAGAQNFLLANIPDVGKTPQVNGDPFSANAATNIATQINTGIANMLPGGLNIMTIDFFGLVQDVVDNGLGGFGNVTDACFDGATVCSDPSDYVFWDNIHPTTAVGALAGQIALDAVAPIPVPAAIWLFAPALAGLLRVGRRAA
ncbi:MAG: SGNH/GDSL hydrolase family protein [Gammaproteobacteria bacterium]|nr:SGNH/GDSL hydrolase family protein [Gammaproteobacteria bacterium]